jgi:hypothetical protein
MEVEILKEALDVAGVKKPILPSWNDPRAMKAASDMLRIARSKLIERVSRRAKPRGRYRKRVLRLSA